MRADRLLNILLMLQAQPRVTARAAAARLEVSPRTIHRDMEALSMAGIPIYAERGRDGGYALLESFRADLHYLTHREIKALFVHNPGVLRDLGLRGATESAAHKLELALSSGLSGDAARVRRHILIDGASWRQSAADHPHLTLLQDALWQTRQLHLHYCRADGTAQERTVHPLGLVAKGRLWYLVAWTPAATEDVQTKGPQTKGPQTEVSQTEVSQTEVSQTEVSQTEVSQTEVSQTEVSQTEVSQTEVSQATQTAAAASFHMEHVRTYRVSRIAAAQILHAPSFVPGDFDLAAYWEESVGRFIANLPRYPVSVWATVEAVRRLPSAGWYLQIDRYGETKLDETTGETVQRVELTFHTEETAIACLVGFGDQIEVIQPDNVARGIVALAEAVRCKHSARLHGKELQDR